MAIRLSDHFNYKKLLRFVLPSILMMVFTSVYGVVDGIFVSTVVGNTAFKAVNLVLPLPMALGSLGFMLGAGGSAIVSKTFGEGKDELANKYFSLLVYVTAIGGVAVAIVGEILLEPFCRFFKADGEYLDYCLRYGRIVIAGVPLFMLQNIFQTFFVTAERPKLGFLVTLIAGCSNIVGDWLLVGVFRFEVEGAAVATVLGEALGAIIPIVYFLKKNNGSILRLGKTEMHGKVLLDACTNGSSEFLSNVSGSFVSMLYNYQLTRLVGSDGVGAYGVLMYVNFIFFAIFIAISMAAVSTSPSGTTRFTSPIRSASAAESELPVKIISIALAPPIKRGARMVPPAPGMIPRPISGNPSFADSPQMRRSQASASSSPPPSA